MGSVFLLSKLLLTFVQKRLRYSKPKFQKPYSLTLLQLSEYKPLQPVLQQSRSMEHKQQKRNREGIYATIKFHNVWMTSSEKTCIGHKISYTASSSVTLLGEQFFLLKGYTKVHHTIDLKTQRVFSCILHWICRVYVPTAR